MFVTCCVAAWLLPVRSRDLTNLTIWTRSKPAVAIEPDAAETIIAKSEA